MTPPASTTGPSADGSDLASTDMSADPSSREGATQESFGGLPVEPQSEAIRRLETELEGSRDQQLRLAAEFDNYRSAWRVSAQSSAIARKRPSSFASSTPSTTWTVSPPRWGTCRVEALREAVTLVDRKFWKQFESAGLERIDPVGATFDPSQHEAVSIVPPPSPEQDHKVSATFQIGYRFKGTLVRPARVQVYSEQGQA